LIATRDRSVIQTVVVRQKQLHRLEGELSRLHERQLATLQDLRTEQARLDRLFAAERARLKAIEASRRASRSAPPLISGSSSGVLQVCPVDQPRAYSNDYGAPRGSGRRHQGNDILAPRGTPIRAPFPGRAAGKNNSLGGLTVKVFGSQGYVYNAHLSSLGSVQTGTVIGYVGNSGDAAGGATHDHFEWHPGNGGAVNPYYMLNQVC
jgi:murein DD-endopeptidase MepM/ murein hydrolase activator NlpD